MSLKCEPASLPQHISVNSLFFKVCTSVSSAPGGDEEVSVAQLAGLEVFTLHQGGFRLCQLYGFRRFAPYTLQGYLAHQKRQPP